MNGILQNSIYSGEIIWNRVRMVKDPSTGRRISRVNPSDNWIRKEVPELRIIAQEVFRNVT
jgi:site-specific DNA recombinase